MDAAVVGSENTITIMASRGVKSTAHLLKTDTCNFTSKTDRKIENLDEKSEYSIRFVTSISVETTVHFLNSDKVNIWGKNES